ncbi:hypothetical protein BHU41_06760 [Lactobacillus crispatus]|uniref:Uncharacterized protein n=1 Tax=Lactobacillus crispatus TaxID=47770 RepID=A0A2M9WP37_9LACO|nr:hypothetical protein BHU41_06760 [Lactobacillus crispatus]
MWILLIYLGVISLVTFFVKKYPQIKFFKYVKQYRGLLISLVSLCCIIYMIIKHGYQPFIYTFILILLVGIGYIVKDNVN